MKLKAPKAPSAAVFLWLLVLAGFACLSAAAFMWLPAVGVAALGLSLLVVAYLVTLSGTE